MGQRAWGKGLKVQGFSISDLYILDFGPLASRGTLAFVTLSV
jgi:hypothetical protein